MAPITLDYNYKGITCYADVVVVDRLFWVFNIESTKHNVFTVQYDIFTNTWKHGSNNFVDPEMIQIIGDELMKIYGRDIQSHRPNYLFSSPDYFTCRIDHKDIIGFWGKKLRIRVSQTSSIKPHTNEDEIHYYGSINSINFFFETENYNNEERGLIIRAIRWYAIYISHPLMKIKSNFYH